MFAPQRWRTVAIAGLFWSVRSVGGVVDFFELHLSAGYVRALLGDWRCKLRKMHPGAHRLSKVPLYPVTVILAYWVVIYHHRLRG